MRPTRAEISLPSLRFNLEEIRKRLGAGVQVMAVVKANGYGHGALGIAKALETFGVRYFGVAFLEEGIELRQGGVQSPILVLGGVLGAQVGEFLDHNLEITVSSLAIAERINEEARAAGKKARVHLKIDTGMERIGVRSDHALPFVESAARLPHLDLVGIFSHFATSDERDKSFAQVQLDRFTSVLDGMQQKGIDIPLKHIANSGAILDLPASYFSLVRPGIMLYGSYPTQETSESIPLKPALSLKSKIVYLKDVPPNTSISYGRKYTTSASTKIATIPIGYADGYSRRLTNQVEVLIHGSRYPGVGTICMDQMMIDVGEGAGIRVGDEVTLLGRDGSEAISLWDLANKLGTNSYEVLTGIAARVPRIFLQ